MVNDEIKERQEKVISILKGTKMSEALNSPKSRKFFITDTSAKGKHLAALSQISDMRSASSRVFL